jgi:hypothetical protein
MLLRQPPEHLLSLLRAARVGVGEAARDLGIQYR